MITRNELRLLVEQITDQIFEKILNEGNNGHSKGQGLDAKKLRKILRKNGYEYDHSNGDHEYYKHPDIPQSMFSITIPYTNKMVWRRMVKEHNIDVNKK